VDSASTPGKRDLRWSVHALNPLRTAQFGHEEGAILGPQTDQTNEVAVGNFACLLRCSLFCHIGDVGMVQEDFKAIAVLKAAEKNSLELVHLSSSCCCTDRRSIWCRSVVDFCSV